MHIGDIDFYKDFLYSRVGLQIQPDQSFVLDSRLTPVARKWNFPNLRAMTMALRGVPDPEMVDDIIDAIVPVNTEFFRDPGLFALIEHTLLPWFARHSQWNRLRLWSAGCATGEEALSLAIAVRQAQQKVKLRNVEIVATDVNHLSLARAERGLYSQYAAQRVPTPLLTQYFTREGDDWQAADELLNMITFQPFNLLDDMTGLGSFDLILCRNVLSAFDMPLRLRVMENLAAQLTPEGLLALGAEESLPSGMASLKHLENHPEFIVPAGREDGL
jgi:chemotaxis protein methyltransferase CheR